MVVDRKPVTDVPENSETPMEAVYSWVTPTRLFFVRNHAEVPQLDISSWSLRVGGCVERPLRLSWEELNSMPQETVFATMECAGNGRSFLIPKAHGVQWGAGAIAHAEWTGVPLRLVLERAGLRPETVEVLFRGGDACHETDHPETLAFERSLPLDKALDSGTLLALRMNGELLEPSHGYPLRLLVPGWYGVASVKWLTHIEAINQGFQGYFQSTKYTIEERSGGGTKKSVVQRMAIKSEIVRPLPDEVFPAETIRIFGLAWTGEDAVAGVAVSTDGGQTWSEAELIGPQSKYSWTLWQYFWTPQQTGTYTVMSRAQSSRGETQPTEHDALRGGYMINFIRPRTIRVEGTSPEPSDEVHADAATLLYDMNAFAEENARVALDVELELISGAGI